MAVRSFVHPLIRNISELNDTVLDRTDEFRVAAVTIHALMLYTEDREASLSFLDYLKGPEPLSVYQKQFIRDRFMDKGDYFIRSYFKGAVPDNNYTPDEPYTVEVSDNPYSYVNDGYAKLFIKSGGADSPREVVMRQKKSTGEWFLWQYEGLLTGIRVPVSDDPWA